MSRYDLRGKVAIVTGGTRGIGFATAQTLLRRGAEVTIVGRSHDDTVEAARRLGAGVLGVGADVADLDAMRGVVEATVDRFGKLDVAVANAGVTARFATVRAMRPDVFENVVRVNLLGAYNTAYSALPHIVENRGHISLVASIYAFTQGVFVAPYAASKAGVEQLGRALRLELSPHDATAGVVCYGFVDTDMVRFEFDTDPLAVRGASLLPWPLNRHLTPDQGAEALVRGIERRAAHVVAPRQWAVMSALRGLVNPGLDYTLSKLPLVAELVAQGDVPDRVDGPATSAPSRGTDGPESSAE
ncbi:SDR family NAD(P)-dependent oxidoreductase [Nocardia asteroides]|uniref:SDR family NAD(P)-dependent oxidoreductase n=1 Tax=Nocardia asteroides TaxID=1824 RepID=UPI003414D14E